MKYELRKLDSNTKKELIELSKKWVEEDCSWGIIPNSEEDLEEPLFVAIDNDRIVGYIFGHYYIVENKTAYIEPGNKCFMIDEIYVLPTYRNKGVGKELFKLMEEYVKDNCAYLKLIAPTKNYKSILHFYVDELDMDFYSATLLKKI